ncbi:hypothetical protein EYF80_061934 [Liparis tanakae]|uniref:Uncharacterized protein n=1 Tax=Liparis tanakae TaxID=230148 RepID=A0A4Z2EH91_9TELE|nr:hypothetical protein EYF80_061934 [Liparis tanakae]
MPMMSSDPSETTDTYRQMKRKWATESLGRRVRLRPERRRSIILRGAGSSSPSPGRRSLG